MPFDINVAFNYVIQACNDNYIGYSMSDLRTTIKLGVTYRTYCDCSSLMSWACFNAGAWSSNPWFSTGDEPTWLQQAGFTRMPANSTPWQPGDILTHSEGWMRPGTPYPDAHTEMVYRGTGGMSGYTMGAHTSKVAYRDQVSIRTYISDTSYWQWLYRAGGSVIPAYHWTQRNTNQYGALTTDEIYGNAILTYYELVNLGFSTAAAAGVMGNIEHEGQFNPAQWEGTAVVDVWNQPRKGYGMMQYTPPDKYKVFADYKGVDVTVADENGPCQIQWLDDSTFYNTVLGGYQTSQFNGSSSQMAGNPHYGISYSNFKLLTDPADAANVWMRSWERSADPGATQSIREASARYWYYEILNNFPSNPGGIVPRAIWPWLPGVINNMRMRKLLR